MARLRTRRRLAIYGVLVVAAAVSKAGRDPINHIEAVHYCPCSEVSHNFLRDQLEALQHTPLL
ncbi:hypothetical protein BH20CHL4_BH20CHL4_13240 [soil metagenome]